MNRRWVQHLAVGIFLLNLLAVTWPAITLFRAPEPLVFGLPMSMAWPIAWILIGWFTLLLVDHFDSDSGSK